ncbi:MAG TPA: DUF3857 domain-containing protein [Chitinophagaceae bacterium]|nr:DUF3857 domain-containing protein [Chitinophagaceae bacterium]
MYHKVFFTILISCVGAKLFAQYPVSAIPDSLKKDARVVVRLNETTYEIKSPSKVSVHEHYVYTVLNEKGRNFGGYFTDYDKFKDLGDLTGTLYDANGKQLKHVKKKDFSDESGSGDETLMTDTRYKEFDFGYGIYPYTVEFEDDYDLDNMMLLQPWSPQEGSGVAVQEGRFTITAPADYVVRYRAFNYSGDPATSTSSNKKTYSWEVKNVTAIKKEIAEPVWHELVPYVMIAPSDFEAEGYKGSMESWLSFGKFINSLLAGKNTLPDPVKQKVHELTDNLSDPKQKIKVLYDFMQKNTRYISIQLGIGGWQPFDANYVYTKKYGDCKALSNYMVALLSEAGLNAKYVVIRAGSDASPMVEDFPSNQFNHATVCVPLKSDTMWLECTSQTLPAGYIGSFTGNRRALLIDTDGGHVVTTKRYFPKDNQIVTLVTGQIDPTGKLNADIEERYTGIYYGEVHDALTSTSKEEQLNSLKEGINLATYDVPSFNYDDHKDDDPYIKQHIKVVADGAASVTGKRMFFTPNFLSQNDTRLDADENRKFDVVYPYDFTQIDTLQYQLPPGYGVEAMPKDVTIDNEFGSYQIHFKVDNDKVFVNRRYERNANRFPPAKYNDLVKFYDNMYKADRSKIVFVKKDS